MHNRSNLIRTGRLIFFQGLLLFIIAPIAASGDTGIPLNSDFRENWFAFCKRPALSFSYGQTMNSLQTMQGELADPPLLEMKIGDLCEEVVEEGSPVIQYHFKYVGASHMSGQFGGTASAGKIDLTSWRLNTSSQEGWGYQWSLGNSRAGIILYHAQGMHLNYIDSQDDIIDPTDRHRMNLFDEAFRFGTMTEAGIRLKPVGFLGIDFGYERAVTFPRFLVGKWIVSEAVEGIGLDLLDRFVQRVMDSSPGAAPVVGFLLKNGFSYGIYELRRNDMHFPFDTAAPLFSENFRIGLTFSF